MIELSLAESVKKLKQVFSSVKVNEKANPIEISINGKPVIVYAKNKCFVRIHNNIIAILPDAEVDYPYEGARLHYILDFSDMDTVELVLNELILVTLPPKRKPIFGWKK